MAHTIARDYYAPTDAQKQELKDAVKQMRDKSKARRAAKKFTEAFVELGWPEAEASKYGELHVELHFPEGGSL